MLWETVDFVWGSDLRYVMGECRLYVGFRPEICDGREQTLCGAQTVTLNFLTR